ncbi:hypothetical protein [Mesorhizobium sp.]|uniref:hypothetical protein n=1 Tax=Mesorhizobium sp. TaxID=1871066 RepID=UPI000FE482F1|nr:hypothetical protein [Mesorhizobium sp.]RWI35400.1 MAG: hypothetical protein EOR14_28260 [Mesorhizobium sp.]RWJ66431.1 MAG: hypothetical protein EOR34_28875 [Mesorhizobium sp.]
MSKAPTKTRANIPPAPSHVKAKFLGQLNEAPTMQAPDHMSGKRLQDMSFKVDLDFHDRLKMASVKYRMSMKDIFQEAVDQWIEAKQRKG